MRHVGQLGLFDSLAGISFTDQKHTGVFQKLPSSHDKTIYQLSGSSLFMARITAHTFKKWLVCFQSIWLSFIHSGQKVNLKTTTEFDCIFAKVSALCQRVCFCFRLCTSGNSGKSDYCEVFKQSSLGEMWNSWNIQNGHNATINFFFGWFPLGWDLRKIDRSDRERLVHKGRMRT